MAHYISIDLKRIGLHDSHFSDIKFEKDNISINLDWGFIENFREENILQSIIFGKAKILFKEVNTQTFKKLTDDGPIEVKQPSSIENDDWLIMTNEFIDNISFSTFIFTMTNNFTEYIEWTINFKKCILTWEKFILHKDWLSGKESIS